MLGLLHPPEARVRTYSRYVDYLDLDGGWVPTFRLALEIGVSEETAKRQLIRLAGRGRVELRHDDRAESRSTGMENKG